MRLVVFTPVFRTTEGLQRLTTGSRMQHVFVP